MDNFNLFRRIRFSEAELNNLVEFNKKDVFLWKKQVGNFYHIGVHWLNIQPLFYSTNEMRYSTRLWSDVSNDEIGKQMYSAFGYIALGRTLTKDIHFLLCDECLVVDSNGNLIRKIKKIDFALDLLDRTKASTLGTEALNKVYLSKLEKYKTSQIILPLSGGFDSTYLALLTREFNSVKSFTYAQSIFRSLDKEARTARLNANQLRLSWRKVNLKYDTKYLRRWRLEFKSITHDHGMYHYEFFENISNYVRTRNAYVLSGIVGDVWAGKHTIVQNINSVEEYAKLFLSHEYSVLSHLEFTKATLDFLKGKLKDQSSILAEPNGRLIQLVRNKMVLLNYMMKSAFNSDFVFITPFLSAELVQATLSVKEREKRLWQKEFFSRYGLVADSKSLIGTSNAQFLREARARRIVSSTQFLLYSILLVFRLDRFFKLPLKKELIKRKFEWKN
jgi:hypothetical protein